MGNCGLQWVTDFGTGPKVGTEAGVEPEVGSRGIDNVKDGSVVVT